MQIAWKCLICYTRKKFIDEKDAILRRQSRINSLNVYLYLHMLFDKEGVSNI